jgi:3-phosphoshikimate 1-carboxyvinyltransferase
MKDDLQITPIPHPINAVVRVPGSKSLTNRALLIASLADGKTRLTNALFSDDSLYFVKALQTLGFDIQMDEKEHEITINGLGGIIPETRANLFIGNAGTAARFLTAFLTLGHGEYIVDGDSRMRERPIGDMLAALAPLGANLSPAHAEGNSWLEDLSSICPPVKVIATGLPGGKTQIAGNVSSQFLSAILMIAPYARQPIEIMLSSELNSKPYVDMTLFIMQDFGVELDRDGYRSFVIPIGKYVSRSEYAIESDASAASYFFAAPALCGGSIKVENISKRSKQGDIVFLDLLQQMGCSISEAENHIIVTGVSELQGIDADMRDIPDTAQTLAILAPFAASPTRIRGIASARFKETDRIHATCIELMRLGVQVDEHDDGMTIYPCRKFNPASIQTYNDHRMAMAFSLIGLRIPGVSIENPECVSKTFPGFFEVLKTLYHNQPGNIIPISA